LKAGLQLIASRLLCTHMLPKTLALIDDDSEYTEYLAKDLMGRGIQVDVFGDSNDLLVNDAAYGFDFYVVDLMLPGVDGIDLIKLLRRRTDAGVLVVSGRLAPDAFETAITSGADMYLAKPVRFEQVAVAIQGVRRRMASVSAAQAPWRLDRQARQLIAPDGARIELNDVDFSVMQSLLEANGEVVTREALHAALGQFPDGPAEGSLNAVIYRLRRRIERATPVVVPLQSKSRVGYVFRAPLKAV
jgi:two-component system OmpR family response regulator